MSLAYEATYENGILKWTHGKPEISNGTKVTVLVESPLASQSRREEIRRILDETRGAWGTGKTLDEIDREIKEMRERDWSRDWDKPNE